MITIPVQTMPGAMYFDSAFPKREYDSDAQKLSPDGIPLWSVLVLLRQPDSRKSESVTITLPSNQNPADVIEPFTPLAFDGLRVMTGENNGRPWVSFAADKVGKPKSDAKE